MNDHIKSEISAYLAGELPESRNRQIEAHAASCEKCRAAIGKARTKQARVKREALKKASTSDMPNLFLSRQSKLAGIDTTSNGKTWMGVVLGVIVVGSFWGYEKMAPRTGKSVLVESTEAPDPTASPAPQTSTAAPVIPAAAPVAPPTAPVLPPSPSVTKPAEPKAPVVLPVIETWHGTDSGIVESRLVVVRTAEKWHALWSEMAVKDPAPEVNFEKYVILGVFAGQKTGGTSISFGKIRDTDDEVVAPYSVAESTTTAIGESTHPYLFGAISHSDKKIRLTFKENHP